MEKCAALRGEAVQPQVVSLWIDLQARLMLLIEEVGSDLSQGRVFPPKAHRPRTLVKNLTKELLCAQAMAESMDILVTDMALQNRKRELTRSLPYQFNLGELQIAYERLLLATGNSDKVSQWIRSRMSIHEFQLEQLI